MNAGLPTAFSFLESPRSWEQGIPVAGKNLGAVLYGVHWDHRVLISHKQLWIPLVQRDLPDMTPYREEMLRLCREGKFAEADAYWMASRTKEGLGGFWWHDPNHPAAELRIRDRSNAGFETRHTLDCSRGEGRISWRSHSHEGGDSHRESHCPVVSRLGAACVFLETNPCTGQN